MPARPATRIRSRSRHAPGSDGGGTGEAAGPAAAVPVSAADAVAMAHAGLAYLADGGYGVAAGRGAGRVPARVRAGRVAAHRGAGRGVSRVHLLRRLRGRRAGLSKGMAAMADPGHERRGGRARSAGRGGWPPTPPSARHWPPGRSRRRGRGRSAPGPPGSPKATKRTPMRSCWPPPPAARNWRTWPGLAEEMRRRCAQPDSDDGGGFADRWLRLDRTLHGAGRVEGDLTPAVHRRAGRGAGRVQQESRPGGHPH